MHLSPIIIVIITSVINIYFLFPTNNNLRTYSYSEYNNYNIIMICATP